MKKSIKLLCGVLAAGCLSCVAAACSGGSRAGGGEYYAYTVSDVVMAQKGVNTYAFEFSADCAGDDVKVYLTENDRIKSKDKPVAVESEEKDGLVRFSFTEDLQLSEEYYLWVVSSQKEVMLPITAPSMFPNIQTQNAGTVFNFNYTAGVSWSSFCDPDGKAVYESDKEYFDETAVPVKTNIAITAGEYVFPSSVFDGDKFYYSVTTAKNGLLKIVSAPVTLASEVVGQIDRISARLTSAPTLEIEVTPKAGSAIAESGADGLQLVVKRGAGDEIYCANNVWSGGKATMSFDATQLLRENDWYDLCLAYRGSVVCDVPKIFNGREVFEGGNTGKDGIEYCVTEWKDTNAPEEDYALKLYFRHDETRYADEFCNYLVTLQDGESLRLNVTVTLKSGVKQVPVLAITGGDTNMLVSAQGVEDDGSYTYNLDISSALTKAGTWYDIRLFFGDVCTELLKDSCIGYSDFAKTYTYEGRKVTFCEWNGILKITFSE